MPLDGFNSIIPAYSVLPPTQASSVWSVETTQ